MKKRILFYGDYDCTTGFGNVMKELVDAVKHQYHVTVLATNNYNIRPYFLNNVEVIPALALKDPKNNDNYVRVIFLKMLYNGNYDLVFCLNDLEVINTLTKHIKVVKKRRLDEGKKAFKLFFYFPIDSEIRTSDLEIIPELDEAITYTNYGRKQIQKKISKKISNNIKVIPHGVDVRFKPKKIIKKNNKLRIGTVNRNSARKDISCTVIAYSYFKKKYPHIDSELYLHCNPKDPFGVNLNRLCERLKLKVDKDVIFPKKFNENKGFTIEKLNDIYNSIDIFVSTTTAEGWGLTIHEAMATGRIIIAPLHTSLVEVTNIGDTIISLKKTRQMVFVNDFEKLRFVSDPKECCDAMYQAFSLNKSTKESLSKKAILRAKHFSWKKSANMFVKLIEKHIG